MRVVVALVAALTALGASAQKVSDFKGVGEIKVTGEGLHRVELPFEAHRFARGDLSDLRIYNGKGTAMPFAFITPTREPGKKVDFPVPLFAIAAAKAGAPAGDVSLDVRAAKDGTLIALRTQPKASPKAPPPAAWVADATAIDEPVDAVILAWERKPGTEVARVFVEASEDLKTWSPLVFGGVVNLEQGGRTLSQPKLEFPARKVKYLRVTPRTEGFVLTGLRVERTGAASAIPTHKVTVGGASFDKRNEFQYDLQAAVPVTQLRLLLAEPNSIAPSIVESRRDEDAEWRVVLASTTFYRMDRDGEEIRSPPVEIPVTSARYWRVKVNPNAGVPGIWPRLEASWIPQELAFVARGEGPFMLAVGNENVSRGDLPLATVIPGYKNGDEKKLALVEVGAVRDVPNLGSWWDKLLRGVEGKKALLWAVLIGGVWILGLMAWRLTKKVT